MPRSFNIAKKTPWVIVFPPWYGDRDPHPVVVFIDHVAAALPREKRSQFLQRSLHFPRARKFRHIKQKPPPT